MCTNTSSDANNCDSCGHSCLGGACTSGQCQPVAIATGQNKPYRITANASAVFWTNSGTTSATKGTIMKWLLAGGSPTILAQNQDTPRGIVADEFYVYWTNLGGGLQGSTSAGVMSVPAVGGPPEPVVGLAHAPGELAVDSYQVYYASQDDLGIYRAMKTGGSATPVSSDGRPYGLFRHEGYVYWTNIDQMRVSKFPVGGGTPITHIAQEQYCTLRGITVLDAEVYFACSGNSNSIRKVHSSGGTVTEVASNQPTPDAVAADASGVYWSTPSTIVRLSGGSVTTIAAGQGTPTSIALTPNSVFWTNNFTGEVMRLAKPEE